MIELKRRKLDDKILLHGRGLYLLKNPDDSIRYVFMGGKLFIGASTYWYFNKNLRVFELTEDEYEKYKTMFELIS